MENGRRHATVALARALPVPEGRRSAQVLAHGSMEVRWYAPKEVDEQTPHDRDELYVVMAGEGWFVNGDSRERFQPGDVLFVPAHAEHRFEDFSHDFGTWVIFYGPIGGETAGG